MATYYFDSSALVKLYVPEVGSLWVDDLVNAKDPQSKPEHVIAMSKIGEVEVAAAVARRERLGQLDREGRDLVLNAFLDDCGRRFFTLALPAEQLRRAVTLTQRLPLRGYDAVHLAAALDLNGLLLEAGLAGLSFVSADAALCAAARLEGLPVYDPNEASQTEVSISPVARVME